MTGPNWPSEHGRALVPVFLQNSLGTLGLHESRVGDTGCPGHDIPSSIGGDYSLCIGNCSQFWVCCGPTDWREKISVLRFS